MGEFADMAIEDSFWRAYGHSYSEDCEDEESDGRMFYRNKSTRYIRNVDAEYENSRPILAEELSINNEIILQSSDKGHYYIGIIKKKTEKAILFFCTDKSCKIDQFWCPLSIIRRSDNVTDKKIYYLPKWAKIKNIQ